YIVAGLLVTAGLFQLSPLKQMCLRGCRSPVGFLLGRWRSGWRGGLAMGWAHAAHCLGCCWALMAVLVVAGAMGLPWVLLIGLAVAAEKLLPRGEWIARAIGVALVLLGAAVAVRPDLAVALRGGGSLMSRAARSTEDHMANAQWKINGEYFEACSCDFVCPCPTSAMTAPPTKGYCDAGLV